LFLSNVVYGFLSACLSYKPQPVSVPSTCVHIVVAAGSGKRHWWGEIRTLYFHINIMETKNKATKG